ncbi:transglycosylase SLT domain-containing protein [Angustibacter sp. McL0619]|uniref:transglycosylase SLT domain-containing protein n=1 Tax=Angustibacter sp. McL0619 TaxID=3415676 RepID=UPI003CF98E8A
MSQLSVSEIYQYARAAGFSPDQAVTWTAIAMAESGGNPDAHAGHGENSYGLWQVNVRSTVRHNSFGDLTDPAVNARAAFQISHHGTDMRPWTTTHASHKGMHSDYRQYLHEVEAIAGGAHGDPRGVGGYGSPLPPPLPESGAGGDVSAVPETVAATTLPPGASTADSDHDGLTDTLEKSIGTDSHAVDSDHDGLSDAYEVVHGSNPMLADSDHDGLSDSLEAALGTSSTTADTDSDGITDSAEVSMGSDPLHSETGPALMPAPPDPALAGGPALPGLTEPAVAPATGSALGSAIGSSAPPAGQADHSTVDTFLDAALRQRGDRYVMGANARLNDPNPKAFDCAELTRWAAHQAGAKLPDGSWMQFLKLKQQGMLIPVDEAVHTPGALLFRFSSEPRPGGLRPDESHVAISLGDGKTIEARGHAYGVNEFSATRGFNYAAVIPGISGPAHVESLQHSTAHTGGSLAAAFGMDPGASLTDAAATLDTDHDGLTDSFEARIGTDPHLADTDHDGLTDGFEVAKAGTDPTSAHSSDGHLSDSLAYATGVAPRDSDHDGLSDAYEKLIGTDAHAVDSDHDGLSDSLEAAQGTNPLSADTDSDGITDSAEQQLGSDPLHANGPGSPLGGALGDGTGAGLPDDPGGTGAEGLTQHTDVVDHH